MVYSSNFVAVVKVNGKVLREQSSTVALPFGSEYSIFLKNMNSVRAVVRVSIDGQRLSDVSDGWIIIGANDTLDLERFVRNGNFQKGNRLKFIERTAQIEEHKGIGIEDGLIRVEYKFEVPQAVNHWLGGNYTYFNNCGSLRGGQTVTTTPSSTPCQETMYRSVAPESTRPSFMKSGGNMLRSKSIKGGPSGQSRSVQAQNMNMMCDLNDAGITVAGSESNQKFSWGSYFPTESTSHVITLKLVGKVPETSIPIMRPVTVQQKPVCVTCGKQGKATHKFCGRCGTALQLL